VTQRRFSQFAVPLAVVGIILMLIVPLPPALLDLLIAANIAAALSILLASMYVRRPLEFATFPALLLVATLFRLGINVSVTRQVLLNGYAGSVVESFGHFVIGGSLVVGLVIFMILIVIQFVVVTKGAERVAEVGARFTLDAMPGKQMAIDADLNAGLIDDDEARRRRGEVSAEADFYGAMDGGSKFVKGDAMAAIIITVINLLGGMLIGVFQRGMPVSEAVSTYSLLTVGDGLVSQVPALMLSVATGLIVTRATTDGDMGSDVMAQFAGQKRALQIAGAGIIGLALIPGLPKIPFVLVGGGLLLLARRLTHTTVHHSTAPSSGMAVHAELTDHASSHNITDGREAILQDMRVDPIELELAFDVVDLVDVGSGGDVLTRVKALRRVLAMELGLILPPVRTRDDLELPASTYRIRVHGVEMARGVAPAGHLLAIGEGMESLPGETTREPVFGLAARWIPSSHQAQAELMGLTVVDRSSVVTTHLAEVVRQHAGTLLSREDVRMLVEALRASHPSVVEELTPALMTLGEIQRVLQSLLDERVPIRDLGRIFDALSTHSRAGGASVESSVEACRRILGPAICASLATDGTLDVLTLDPLVEQELLGVVRGTGEPIAVDGSTIQSLGREVGALLEEAENAGRTPALVCAGPLRAPLRRLLIGEFPRLDVLGYDELVGPVDVRTVGVVSRDRTTVA
jgi:flagellar biosynthesis protein FlhA